MKPDILTLLKQHFPKAEIDEELKNNYVNSFPERDSLAHYGFLMLVEETYDVRFSVDEMAELKGLEEIHQSLQQKGISF